jgi:hypothetical protein
MDQACAVGREHELLGVEELPTGREHAIVVVVVVHIIGIVQRCMCGGMLYLRRTHQVHLEIQCLLENERDCIGVGAGCVVG